MADNQNLLLRANLKQQLKLPAIAAEFEQRRKGTQPAPRSLGKEEAM